MTFITSMTIKKKRTGRGILYRIIYDYDGGRMVSKWIDDSHMFWSFLRDSYSTCQHVVRSNRRKKK